MEEDYFVTRLLSQLNSGNSAQQLSAANAIRDLGGDPHFRAALSESSAVSALVGLLGSDAELSAKATDALKALAEEDALRTRLLEAGGIANLLALVRETQSDAALTASVLQVLLAIAVDDPSQLAVSKANGVAVAVKILEAGNDEIAASLACQLLGRLGHNKVVKNSVREQGGISQMLRKLQQPSASLEIKETTLQALTILLMDNEVNQDHVRESHGIEPIVKLLDARVSVPLTSAATTFLTVLCISNDDNKNQLRELWVIPLLVNLLEQESHELQERAVDCLRVLTTLNELNKLSLFSIPAGVRSLVRIMTANGANEVITERAAAVIGNLSTTEQFFSAIRECGGLQRLVTLLDSGPESRVTEIAAKTLANMAGNENNRQGIRLAGGRAPLIHLLTLRPSGQVLMAAEEALRRLHVSNDERNAILETLRYCEQWREAPVPEAPSRLPERSGNANHTEAASAAVARRPLTQYTVEQTCQLMRALGFRQTDAFEANGVTGGDLLELSSEEMANELSLTSFQVKKVQNIQRSFDVFEAICGTGGRGEASQFELREWLRNHRGRSDDEIQAIVDGLKSALSKQKLTSIAFWDFTLNFQWFTKTLQSMAAGANSK